jgi:hypothetical protein
MHQTFAARGFLLLEGTFVQPHLGVLQQFIALLAKFTLAFMVIVAVYVNHCFNGLLFSFYSGMFSSHLGTFHGYSTHKRANKL